jgi:hypothetical protein
MSMISMVIMLYNLVLFCSNSQAMRLARFSPEGRIMMCEFRHESANRNTMKTNTSILNASLMAPFIAAAIALCPVQTRADSIALSFTPSGMTFFGGAGADTVGWGFSLSAPVVLTQLGVWDENGDGLGQSHLVTVWNSTGTVIEAQITVPSGKAASITSGFRYVTLSTPILLSAGNYTIGTFLSAFGSDTASISASAISTASGVTYAGSRATAGNAFPSTDDFSLPNSYFGPNFQFTSPTSVPDTGSTFGLLFLSLIALIGANRLCSVRLT